MCGCWGSGFVLFRIVEAGGVLNLLVSLKASTKASKEFVLSLGAPEAVTPLILEESIMVVMPPSKP